jgi:enoyl-CoA hydratase/3-hydroxyacyl-CoA dehydrogenase
LLQIWLREARLEEKGGQRKILSIHSTLSSPHEKIPNADDRQERSIAQVAILGAGTMGHGIAQLAASVGCKVTIRDVKQEFLDSGLGKINWSLGKLVEKGKITKEQASEILGRITTTLDLRSALAGADLVIEAVPEDLKLKKEIFSLIDKDAPKDAILASNTSAMPVEEIARATSRPEKVIGMHFFNPPQLMPLVEITPNTKTEKRTVQTILDFSARLGKQTVVCKKYVPGFIVNNILGAMTRSAIVILESNEASVEEIDSALKSKANFPMGLFEVADYSGLDILFNIEKFYNELGYSRYLSPLVEKLVREGKLGAKTGIGFYEWKGGKRPEIRAGSGKDFDITPIIAVGTNAAAELIRQDVSEGADIDKALRLGLGYKKGILEIADEFGLDKILESLNEFNLKYKEKEVFKPSALLIDLVNKKQLGKKTMKGFYDYKT